MDANLNETQRRILENVVDRLRRSADQVESVIRSGDSDALRRACSMLHATETQARWVEAQRAYPDDRRPE